jgi:Tfp pilus assembly protein PilE
MRAFAIAVIIAALTLPAYAQDPSKEESNKAETEKKKEAAEIEKAYKDAAKRLPPPPPAKKPDPWSNIR